MPKYNEPIYPISVASKLLDVHPRTLRLYEEANLITPERKGNKRYFSDNDIEWIKCIRSMIHDDGISIPGIKKLLKLIPCHKIKNCSDEIIKNCRNLKRKKRKCWEILENICEKNNKCKTCKSYNKLKIQKE